MSNQGTVRLGDVATYINGYAFKPSDWSDNGLPIIRIQNLTGNDYQTNYYNKEYNPKYLVKKGDVLISWSASLGVFVWEKEDALLNQHIFKVVFDKIDVDKDYFCLTVEYLLKRMGSEVHGSTMKHITKPRFDNTLFPLPDKDTQKQISKKIITVDKLIHKYKVIAQKLDKLVKSRFVEMFGDPVSNPMKWHRQQLNELTNKIGSGATPRGGRDSYCIDGISLIRSMNVHNGFFEYKDLAHISDEQATKLSNVTIQKKDVLLNITGASVARCCIVPDDILPARVNQHVCVIRCNDYVIPIFVCKAFTSDSFQKYLLEIAGSGATREAITKQQIESIPMIVPPLSLQNQFADFVAQIDKSKLSVQKSIDKLETLKKSLMQKFFG
ncbi:restriction endonuclease subunit S [Ruminococcus sp. JE7B6]|uniref:restriction endonuclease subunit S n=1 Tax=Ruminococcus sp. JE7B6 TaxID=3233380 RepID=UPI003899C0FC